MKAAAMASLVQLSPEMKAKEVKLWRHRDYGVYYVAFNMNDPTLGLKYPEVARKEIEEKREAAGTAVRFEPGQTREVELVAYAGKRMVYGFNGLVMGPLDGGE